MKFKIDKQTLEELQILGKYKEGSQYHMFNRVKTYHGEQLLDEIFRCPLLDEMAINNRSATFRYFQDRELEFPYDPSQITRVREYMDSASSDSLLSASAKLLTKRLMSMLIHDHRYQQVVEGIHATVAVLRQTSDWIASFENPTAFVQQWKDRLYLFLQKPKVKEIQVIDIFQSIPLSKLAQLDYCLKTQLREDLEQLFDFIAWADVAAAVAAVASQHHLNYAEASPAEDNLLECKNLRHPSLKHAVGNDLKMNLTQHVLFLTGANMAGKSTWMKALGISIYMAHLGFPVAADSFRFSVKEGICSSINTADSIDQGYSHFYAEVMRVKEAATLVATGLRLFLIFDELFKGTNVKDAYDGTLAVVQGLADYRQSLMVVSTHIVEVGAVIGNLPGVQCRFMPTTLENGMPRYTYRLQAGITEDRQGMMIIQNEGILDMLENCQ
ncbi:DNA mismatch repair protein [Sphingobacterium thalpophilum]|uniref:MutS-related protein n=1 Tax=Sphingobacterium thalpophilum TaxID=259 RepID=UPI0037D9EC1C